MRKFLSLFAVLCVGSIGQGAVDVSVTGPGGSFTTPVENPPGSGLWEFSVRKVAVSDDASDTEFTVLTAEWH